MTAPFIARSAHGMRRIDNGFELTVRALEATQLPDTPGWLTGESPIDQGLETEMPNLPRDLQLPGLRDTELRLRVRALGPSTVRLTLAPPTHQLWSEDDLWPGILIQPSHHEACTSQVTESDDSVELAVGGTTLRVGTGPFSFSLDRGPTRLLRTGERLRQVAGFPMAPPVVSTEERISVNLEMGVEEKIYGFGEQFSAIVKNGQRLTLEANDALGTGTGRAYKPVPLWHSSAGYTAFVNTGAVVTADIGHERPSVLGLELDDAALDVVLFSAPSPSQRLTDYTSLTGRAQRPDLFAFGYWMGRCRYHSAAEMLDVASRLHEEQIPADVLHLDPDWLVVDRLNTDFIWNEERFGDRADFIAALREQGLRLSLWQLPYLDPTSPIYDEAERSGRLLRMPDGSAAHIQGTPTPDGRPRALYDYTNPSTIAWLEEQEKPFFDDGLAVIKTDFGEGCPSGAAAHDGTPGNYIHNLYPLKYNGAIYDAMSRVSGKKPLVWGRSGWAGSQRYPGQWGGDAESTVVGMQATLRGGLSYALSAPGFWSHDIGGFYGPELTPGLYVRWTQLGALSPLMRAHGLRPREPWAFGDEALRISREWVRLRYSLLPYIWQVGREVQETGMPFIRPLWLEFPDDAGSAHVDDEYLFGHDLLVAPVFDDTTAPVDRDVYLPEGVWYDFATDERFEGPTRLRRKVSLDQMPIFVRGGAVIPRIAIGPEVESTEDVHDVPWTLHAWGDAVVDPSSFEGFEGAPVIAETIMHAGKA